MRLELLWRARFHNKQSEFRYRLAKLRSRQIDEAKLRYAATTAAWLKAAEQQKERKELLEAITCPNCGGFLSFEVAETGRQQLGLVRGGYVCSCEYVPRTAYLIRLLRRMAGINGGHPESRIGYDQKSGGPPGSRSVRPGAWDNVIRAMEDG